MPVYCVVFRQKAAMRNLQEVVQGSLPSSDLMYPQGAVTSHITQGVSRQVHQNVIEHNDILHQKKETSFNQMIQSMINDMWPVVTRTIKSSINISNIDKDEYDQMVETLMPQLVQTIQSSDVRRVLGYPVVEDEVKLVIPGGSNRVRRKRISYSIYDLTDKMFSRMVFAFYFKILSRRCIYLICYFPIFNIVLPIYLF